MNRWKGPLLLFFAFSLAGTSVVAAKLVSNRLGTFTITAVSLFFALLILLPACGGKLAGSLGRLTAKRFLLIALQAVCGIFFFRVFLLYGLLHTSALEAGILTGATPALTALLAAAVLRETANGKKLAGILCTVSGVALIQGLGSAGGGFSLAHLGGNLLVLCAAASESVFNILSRVSAAGQASDGKEPIHPIVQTAFVTAIALILCIPPALFESPARRLAEIGLQEWLALLWYGLFVTALAFVLWYAGIRHCGAFTAAAFSGMMPFASMLLSMVLLGERAGWQQCSGGLLVIAGMVLIGTGDLPVRVPVGCKYGSQKERRRNNDRDPKRIDGA